ncbi:hypothetical protein PR048_014626 [Dryococelus australis]|uniref:Uncharacterized protein n=1 Tax=Dryococelus australis TaxID=614101 RepID=A0ABQ9HER9_9NEOP|nr:hypothetical protein PR048_014626 [Dryococelus australis]
MGNQNGLEELSFHKQEGRGRIIRDAGDKAKIIRMLELCMHPLNPLEHPEGLVNIVSVQVASKHVNDDDTGNRTRGLQNVNLVFYDCATSFGISIAWTCYQEGGSFLASSPIRFKQAVRGRGAVVARLLTSHQGEPGSITSWVTHVFVREETGRTLPLAGGFSPGIPTSPSPSLHSAAAHRHLAPPLQRFSILTSFRSRRMSYDENSTNPSWRELIPLKSRPKLSSTLPDFFPVLQNSPAQSKDAHRTIESLLFRSSPVEPIDTPPFYKWAMKTSCIECNGIKMCLEADENAAEINVMFGNASTGVSTTGGSIDEWACLHSECVRGRRPGSE